MTNEAPDLDEWRTEATAKLAKLRGSNQDKYRAILRQELVPNPSAILRARIDALLEMILDADGRLAFDLVFEGNMTEVLNECLADARQQQITGKKTPGGLILP